MLQYIAPWDPGTANHGSDYFWRNPGNKAAPRKLTDVSSLISGVTDFTAYVRTNYIDPGYGIDESCFEVNGSSALRVVDHYRLYDSSGSKVDLTNKAFSIAATASGTNDFPNNQMYAYAGPNGVWLDHKYKEFVSNSTVWKNSNPNATALEKTKSYNKKNSYTSTCNNLIKDLRETDNSSNLLPTNMSSCFSALQAPVKALLLTLSLMGRAYLHETNTAK